MKKIKVNFENGETYEIPLECIAKNRADYYKEKGDKDFNYQEEVDFVMNDSYEGIDWAENNMDWSYVKDFAKKVSEQSVIDLEEQWTNAKKEII